MSGEPVMSFGLILIAGVVGLLLVVGLIVVVAAVASSSGKRDRRED
jgi:hypothetical protein